MMQLVFQKTLRTELTHLSPELYTFKHFVPFVPIQMQQETVYLVAPSAKLGAFLVYAYWCTNANRKHLRDCLSTFLILF